MSNSEDAGKYKIENQQMVLGQVIGDYATVYMNGLVNSPTVPVESVWNVPHRQNPFFTGRENIITRLHERLTTTKGVTHSQAQAISGLGGIGKTQTAVEYAYRYGEEYQFVLWANANSRKTLISDFVAIADLLNLPEKSIRDHNLIVNAVKRWMQSNSEWLLILDNADPSLIEAFVPAARGGHVLLTTRTQATGGVVQHIELDKMSLEEGALFLLRRANMITPNEQDKLLAEEKIAEAKEITNIMDGLPLALDQAGAYIEETQLQPH